MEEKYFVTSNGDSPERLFFDKDKAFETLAAYVDSFDANGQHVQAYKYVDELGGLGYTTNF